VLSGLEKEKRKKRKKEERKNEDRERERERGLSFTDLNMLKTRESAPAFFAKAWRTTE
jgi:hypothetical protein